MARRTTPSLVLSEYVSPDSDNSVQVWQARLRVIEAAKRVYPIFLKKLSTDVFPLYCQLAKDGKLAKGRNDFDKALWGKSPYDALTDDGGLKSALSKWAAHFNAEADWLMVGALRTLRGWYVAPEWRESLAWDPNHGRWLCRVCRSRYPRETLPPGSDSPVGLCLHARPRWAAAFHRTRAGGRKGRRVERRGRIRASPRIHG
jgi:hypothetical protein